MGAEEEDHFPPLIETFVWVAGRSGGGGGGGGGTERFPCSAPFLMLPTRIISPNRASLSAPGASCVPSADFVGGPALKVQTVSGVSTHLEAEAASKRTIAAEAACLSLRREAQFSEPGSQALVGFTKPDSDRLSFNND